MEYNELENQFKILAGATHRSDIGEYQIQMKVYFIDGTYEQTYQGSFQLTVWDDPEEIIIEGEELWFPHDPIYETDWTPTHIVREETI